MTQPMLLEAARQRAAAVSSLIQGEVPLDTNSMNSEIPALLCGGRCQWAPGVRRRSVAARALTWPAP